MYFKMMFRVYVVRAVKGAGALSADYAAALRTALSRAATSANSLKLGGLAIT